MNPDFSEFSYGFALTNELCRRAAGRIKLAPVFPSLVDEGRRGFDVALAPGYPLFLQFKLSQYMTRTDAREWNKHLKPYYRFWMPLSRHSQQHAHLLKLDQDPNVVLYAAPMFHTVDDLDRTFLTSRITSHSIFFRPRDIGEMPDGDAHSISFVPGQSLAWRHSEAVPVSPYAFGDGLLDALGPLIPASPPQDPSADLFGGLAAQLLEPLELREDLALEAGEGVEPAGQPIHFRSARVRAASAARTVLGAELLWLYRDTVT